jgi:hypothetical protein
MLCPLRCTLIVVDAIVIVHVVQLSIAQESRLGTATAEVTMPVVHVTEARGATVMRTRAHVSVMPLTSAQDAAAPLGAFFINVVRAIFLTLAAVKPLLALTVPAIERVLIASLFGHVSNGGVVDEGGTDSMTITPCRSSNVAVAGTVVVTSLVTSLNSVINMATIVCSGMCAGGGGRDSAHGG